VDETLSTRDLAETRDDERRADEAPQTTEEERQPLVAPDEASSFATRWREIQVDFVDRPRESVERADALVAELMQRLAAGFADERSRLEQQWDGGDEVSTEDLRLALTRYRSFFDRLLSAKYG